MLLLELFNWRSNFCGLRLRNDEKILAVDSEVEDDVSLVLNELLENHFLFEHFVLQELQWRVFLIVEGPQLLLIQIQFLLGQLESHIEVGLHEVDSLHTLGGLQRVQLVVYGLENHVARLRVEFEHVFDGLRKPPLPQLLLH